MTIIWCGNNPSFVGHYSWSGVDDAILTTLAEFSGAMYLLVIIHLHVAYVDCNRVIQPHTTRSQWLLPNSKIVSHPLTGKYC
jgi:hypothetical protein